MTGLAGGAALVCVGLGIACSVLVLARTRDPGQALRVLLDLLLAAGLLRLTSDAPWQALATAAVVVGLRELVAAYGLRPAMTRSHVPRAGERRRRWAHGPCPSRGS